MIKQSTLLILVAVVAVAAAVYMYVERKNDQEDFSRRQDELEARIEAEENEVPQTVFIAGPPRWYGGGGWRGGRRGRRGRH